MRALHGSRALPFASNSLLSDEVRAARRAPLDPWLVGADAAPPGKRLQIAGIGASQFFRTDCRRRQVGDLVYPLLAQPVVELCLAIRTTDLAGADYDRPFARAAFADRLPAAVLERRAKGELTSFFARWVARSAETLRPFLLDGCLCAAGVLDRERVAQALEPQQMIWAPEPGDLISAAILEAWVRHWQKYAPDSEAAPRQLSAV